KGGVTGTNMGYGASGVDGQPPDMATMMGKGGGGDMGSGCSDGVPRKPGDTGGPGAAGPAPSSPDTLTLTGLTRGDGGDGLSGMGGQGGGGGGGRRSGMFCAPGSADGNGASGGGGGAGGCGGKGGGGGKAGGSSIGIVSLGTRLALTDVTLATGKG